MFYFQSFSSMNPHYICHVGASVAWPCSDLLVHCLLVPRFRSRDDINGVSAVPYRHGAKRGLEPPWEVPVGEGRSKSIFISSGVCLSALDPLTEDSKCFSLSSGIAAGVVSSLLLCSGDGRAHDGLRVCCNAAEACPVLPPFPLADPRNPLKQIWLLHPEITLGTYSVVSVQSALQTGST